jgi:hypothetical protein
MYACPACCRMLSVRPSTFDRVFLPLAQADSTKHHQKDLDVTLTSDRHVLILDDTEQVWARHKGNLIQVRPHQPSDTATCRGIQCMYKHTTWASARA